jgi:hypothetical protein
MMKKWMLLFCFASEALAQLPHEVFVLANQRSEDSVRAAALFMEWHEVPAQNLLLLDLPPDLYKGRATCSPEAFTKQIWTPAQHALKKRDLKDQIIAWVYSVDFPIRIASDKNDRRQVSICGQTFIKNRPIDPAQVEQGAYLSDLFAGPNKARPYLLMSLSLNRQASGVGTALQLPEELHWLAAGLGTNMPLPSMMLGYTGVKGSTFDEVVEALKKGSRAQLRSGAVNFITNDNVRTTARSWQFETAAARLEQRGIQASIRPALSAERQPLLGVLHGLERIDLSEIPPFLPGAMAEHLTSWSAEFQKPQMKCTEWISAGATLTSGSVVEPYANADKFPSARFFEHYTAGCSALESFYQSVACPLQQLFLGNPLTQPFGPKVRVSLLGLSRLETPFTYRATAISQQPNPRYRYTFLLDGKVVHRTIGEAAYHCDPATLSDGYHTLQVIAELDHVVSFYGTATKGFHVDQQGRSIGVDDIKEREKQMGVRPSVSSKEVPKWIEWRVADTTLARSAYTKDLVLKVDQMTMALRLPDHQLVAIYADGMQVASEPFQVE